MITKTVIKAKNLNPALKSEIWQFYSQFHDRDADDFMKSLSPDKKVLLLRDKKESNLVGMCTIKRLNFNINGKKCNVYYLGSALLKPQFRGKNVMQSHMLKEIIKEKIYSPFSNAYILSPTMSHKSYLSWHNNIAEFWPKHNVETPRQKNKLLEIFSNAFFGNDWNPRTGILEGHGTKRVKADQTKFKPSEKTYPPVKFYLERNPGYVNGDALVCLIPVNWKNFYTLIKKLVSRRKPSVTSQRSTIIKESSC